MIGIVGAHPSRGTENACEWVVTSFSQWRPGRTATPLSAPSRRMPRRRNAGRQQSQYRGPKERDESQGDRERKKHWRRFTKKTPPKRSFCERCYSESSLRTSQQWKMKPPQNKEERRELFRRLGLQSGSAVFLILIDTDHHTVQSCLVRVLKSAVCQKCQHDTLRTPLYKPCLPLCQVIFFWQFVSVHYETLGQKHYYWNNKCTMEIQLCRNRMSFMCFCSLPYLAKRLRLSHQNQ